MAPCDTSGSGAEMPSDTNDLLVSHGPLPESTSLFMGFVFMLTASSDNDRKSNQTTSDGEEGEKRGFSSQLELDLLFQAVDSLPDSRPVSFSSLEYVPTAPYNKQYTERQLEAGGGMILPEFNEEQVRPHFVACSSQNYFCST